MEKTSIKKNFFYQTIYEVLIIIMPFITSPYVARVIGAKGLGIYSYTSSIAYYFILFGMLGIKNYGNRIIAKNRDNSDRLNTVFSNVFFVHFFISIFCFLIYVIYALNVKEDRIYALIQITYVFSGVVDISWFYFGIEKFKLTVIRNIFIRLMNVLLIFILVRNSNDLWKYCFIMGGSTLISQMSLWIPIRKYVKIVKPTISEMMIHLKPMFVLFIPAIAVSLYKYMDKIMIGYLATKTELGFYENAEKVINIPITVISAFGTVMLPKMSNIVANNKQKKSMEYIELSMRYIMCLAFGLTFGLASVGGVFAPVFWGSEFIFSGSIIMCLAITIPFISFANVIRTQYLIPYEKDKVYIVSVIAGAILNLLINYLLIPRWGALGATIGTIFAEILVCLIQAFSVKSELPIKKYIHNFISFFEIGFLMFVVVYFMGMKKSPSIKLLIMQVLIGGLIYVFMIVTYLYIIKEENFIKLIHKNK